MTSRAVSPVFAGRQAELTALADAFGDAADGQPRMVLVGAEAGGGKSRLIDCACSQQAYRTNPSWRSRWRA